jgi:hypothetical protein
MKNAPLAALLSTLAIALPCTAHGNQAPPVIVIDADSLVRTDASSRRQHADHAEHDSMQEGTHDERHDRRDGGCPRDVAVAFAGLDDALRALRHDVDELQGRRQRELRQRLAAVFMAATDARDRACRAAIPPPPPVPTIVVLDERSEKTLHEALRRESFDDGRLRVVQTTVRDLCVTPRQTRELIASQTFSRGRLDMLRQLSPFVVNDGTMAVVFDGFTFDADKREAQRILTETSTVASCRLHQ